MKHRWPVSVQLGLVVFVLFIFYQIVHAQTCAPPTVTQPTAPFGLTVGIPFALELAPLCSGAGTHTFVDGVGTYPTDLHLEDSTVSGVPNVAGTFAKRVACVLDNNPLLSAEIVLAFEVKPAPPPETNRCNGKTDVCIDFENYAVGNTDGKDTALLHFEASGALTAWIVTTPALQGKQSIRYSIPGKGSDYRNEATIKGPYKNILMQGADQGLSFLFRTTSSYPPAPQYNIIAQWHMHSGECDKLNPPLNLYIRDGRYTLNSKWNDKPSKDGQKSINWNLGTVTDGEVEAFTVHVKWDPQAKGVGIVEAWRGNQQYVSYKGSIGYNCGPTTHVPYIKTGFYIADYIKQDGPDRTAFWDLLKVEYDSWPGFENMKP